MQFFIVIPVLQGNAAEWENTKGTTAIFARSPPERLYDCGHELEWPSNSQPRGAALDFLRVGRGFFQHRPSCAMPRRNRPRRARLFNLAGIHRRCDGQFNVGVDSIQFSATIVPGGSVERGLG